VLIQVIDKLSQSCQTISISIDLDFIDSEDSPGVETPAPEGIKAGESLN
jgi:arginase